MRYDDSRRFGDIGKMNKKVKKHEGYRRFSVERGCTILMILLIMCTYWWVFPNISGTAYRVSLNNL